MRGPAEFLSVVIVGSTALLLGFTGVGFANEIGNIDNAGASATVHVVGTGTSTWAMTSDPSGPRWLVSFAWRSPDRTGWHGRIGG